MQTGERSERRWWFYPDGKNTENLVAADNEEEEKIKCWGMEKGEEGYRRGKIQRKGL